MAATKRKSPQSTRSEKQSSADLFEYKKPRMLAHCSSCGHDWFLRVPRVGRCPGCMKIGYATVISGINRAA